MIVKNEAALLARCIDSVRSVADEIVVVDTGSTDETPDLAEAHGVKLVRSDWRDDFSYSRNISLDQATSDWILWLDADDIVPPQSLPELAALKARAPDRVFGLVVRNQKPGNTGSEFVQARMFPNDSRLRFEGTIHEQIMPSALRAGLRLEHTQAVIEHHGYADPNTMRRKARRNLALLHEQYESLGRQPVNAIEIADSYTICGEEENARIWYERVLAAPNAARQFPAIVSQARMGLGNIENRRGNYCRALEHFEQARRLCPTRPDVVFCLAVARELSGDGAGAQTALRSVLTMKRSPELVGVDFRETRIKTYLRLIRMLVEQEDREQLEPLVAQAVNDCGDRPEIHAMTGVAWYRLGKLMKALHSFEKSLALRVEGNVDAYIGLMLIYRKAGKEELARNTFEKIAPAFHDHPRLAAFAQVTGIGSVNPGIKQSDAYEREVQRLRQMYAL